MEKEKKQKQLSPRIIRAIEILSNYYEIDMEKRVITLELHYDSVDDLLEKNITSKSHPVFNGEILKKVSDTLDTFPLEFKVDLKIKVDDYGDYDPDKIVQSFKDSLEMFHYGVERIKSFRWIEAIILALISVGILFIRKFALDQKFIDDSVLLTEMLDITAWVFLWQGVTVLFLTPDNISDINFKVLDHLNSLELCDKNDQSVRKVTREKIVESWIYISRREKLSTKTLLISGAIALATGIMTFVNGIATFISLLGGNNPVWLLLISFVIFLGIVIVPVIGGIGAINIYRQKGPLQRAVPFVSIIYMVVDTIYLGSMIYVTATSAQSAKDGVSILLMSVISVLTSVLYFTSYLMLRRARKDSLPKEN